MSKAHRKRGKTGEGERNSIAKKAVAAEHASRGWSSRRWVRSRRPSHLRPRWRRELALEPLPASPLGHLGPPSPQAAGRGHTPMEDVTSASSAPRSGPAPAVLTPESRLSRADSRVPPRPPPNRGTGRRSAEKRPHGPRASGTLRLRTQLQSELANPGPEPRFRLARAAVASGTGSPASGSWARASRYSGLQQLGWGVEARASPPSPAPRGMPLSRSANAGPSVHQMTQAHTLVAS